MSRRFALITLTMVLFLGLLFAAPLWAAKGGNGGGGGGGGKPGNDDPPPPEPPPFKYELQILPMLDDGDPDTPPKGQVRAMNKHGDMVGTSGNVPVLWTDNEGMLWTDDEPGEMVVIPLNSLLPAESDWLLWAPQDINDSGQISCVGYLLPDLETGYPVRFTPANDTEPAIVEDLSTIGMVEVRGINNLGHVTGYRLDSDVLTEGLVYTGTAGALDADDLTVIPTPANGRNLLANDINDRGQVTGSVSIDGAKYAFRYTPPTEESAAEFITFALSEHKTLVLRSSGLDINFHGQVVGDSFLKGTLNYRPYLYTDESGITDLTGAKGIARAINFDGDVTGWTNYETGSRGFIYLNGIGVFNLDDMVIGDDADLAVWNSDAIRPAAINDAVDNTSGQISGHISTGPDVPFLLTPQPLP